MAATKRTQYTIPLMVLAFITIGAFGYWLHISTEAVRVAIAEEEAAREEEQVSEPFDVNLDDFGADPTQFVGEDVRLQGMQAFNQFSPALFNALLPDGQMYLVFIERGFSAQPGTFLNVVGTVRRMSDQVIDDWQERGVFQDPAQRQELSVGATYIEADAVAAVEEEPGAAGQPGTQD